MPSTDVIAVVGACPPERRTYAARLARSTLRPFLPASHLVAVGDATASAPDLARDLDGGRGVVVEFPHEASILEIIGTLAHPSSGVHLRGIICVVDAPHLVDDLRRDTYVATGSTMRNGMPHTHHTAHALLAVQQLEYASAIVLVNWAGLSTPDLSITMALVSHLAPRARLRLQQQTADPLPAQPPVRVEAESPGWVQLLIDEYEPYMTDPRVSALRYESVRPFHPERLRTLLDERIERGDFGLIVRSAGFCRFATRSDTVAQWDHVGSMIAFTPAQTDDGVGDAQDLLAVGQDLALIGLDLHREAIRAAFDDATLTDAELAAGPESWTTFEDPFPAWEVTRSGE